MGKDYESLMKELQQRLAETCSQIELYEKKVSFQTLNDSLATKLMARLVPIEEKDKTDCKTPEDKVKNEARLIELRNIKTVLETVISRLKEKIEQFKRYGGALSDTQQAVANLNDLTRQLAEMYSRLSLLSRAVEVEEYSKAKAVSGKGIDFLGTYYLLAKGKYGKPLKPLLSPEDLVVLNLGTMSARDALTMHVGEVISTEVSKCKEQIGIQVYTEEHQHDAAKTLGNVNVLTNQEPEISTEMQQTPTYGGRHM